MIKRLMLTLSMLAVLGFGTAQFLVANPYSPSAMCLIGCSLDGTYTNTACVDIASTCNGGYTGGFPNPTPYDLCRRGCDFVGGTNCDTYCSVCPD